MPVSSRATNILLVLILAVGVGIVAMLASGARGGPLDPPGAPSATGTLPQVEPRMPIPPVGWNGTFPITISQSGSYFLTRNLTGVANTDGIDITTPSDVTIDLNGFTLTGSAATGIGIYDAAFGGNVVVYNGTLTNWFVGLNLSQARRARVSGLSVTGSSLGMTLSFAMVEDCQVTANNNGIRVIRSVIRHCQFTLNTGDAVAALGEDTIENNYFAENGSSGNGNWDIAVHNSNNVIRDNSSFPVLERFVGIFPLATLNTVMGNRYNNCLGIVDNSGGVNVIPAGATLEGTNVCFD